MKKSYKDTTLPSRERAKLLLKELSTEEKVYQLAGYMPFSEMSVEEYKKKYPIGAGQISSLGMRGLNTISEAIEFQHKFQEQTMKQSPHQIPAVFHMEGLCGALIPEAGSFPSGIGRASGWNPELEEQIGEMVGRQERCLGITYTLAPVLDISRDSRMGRQGETYGEDPALASALGVAYTKGVQKKDETGLKTDAVAKHFLGFHAGSAGIHAADAAIPYRVLREIYAKPFQAAITEANLRGIMPCYNSLNDEPVSASEEVLRQLLREEMGFDGVTCSDYGAIRNIHDVHKLCENLFETGYRALCAGMDLELPNAECYGEALMNLFLNGEADEKVVDEAVERVLTAKFDMGIFEHPFAMEADKMEPVFHKPKDEDLIRQSAAESMVLLKNDGTLPLRDDIKIALIGYQAKTARIFFGGYTHLSMAEGLYAAVASMAGVRIPGIEAPKDMKCLKGTQIQSDKEPEFEQLLQKQKPGIKSLWEEMQERCSKNQIMYSHGYDIAGDDTSGFKDALRVAKEADVVVVTLGGKYGTSSIASMGEGIDAVDIGLPVCQELFLQELEKIGKPVVGIHFNGRPISSDTADRVCNAILEAWNPAEKGAEVITDVLFGKINPSGKLPVTVARCAGQIPIYYNHPNGSSWHQGSSIGFPNYVDCSHKPRYAFGYGLSYTTFEYRNFYLEKKAYFPTEKVRIMVDIQNTGMRYGEEIVQIYMQDEFASMIRPNQELIGFCRVPLNPGEQKTIEFEFDMSVMAFIDRKYQWKIEAGKYNIMVAASSADIRLQDELTVVEDRYISGKNRMFYAKTNIR